MIVGLVSIDSFYMFEHAYAGPRDPALRPALGQHEPISDELEVTLLPPADVEA